MCGCGFTAKLPPVSTATTQSKESNMKRKLGMALATAAIASLALTTGASAAGGSAAVTMTPANLDFGNQTVGTTSAPREITLDVPCMFVLDLRPYGSITCTAPGKVEAIGATGEFAQSNDCVLPINNTSVVGDVVTCTVDVTYTPTSVGPDQGAINLTSYGQVDAYTADLTGQGVAPPSSGGGDTGNGGSQDKAGQKTGSGNAAGVSGKKCKKAKKGSKAGKARKCAKKKARR
jgi:hypothetical protein